jgi:hypothetical protein
MSSPAPTINLEESAELVNLYHLAMTAMADSASGPNHWERMSWAARMFHVEHPEVSVPWAYKLLGRLLS